jgi:2-dehydro-3-deoxygluconokinase
VSESKRVISFGEVMLRLSPPGFERLFQSPGLQTYFGGSEANTAVSLAHLGLTSDFVTRVPDNAVGEAVLGTLRREGVGVRGVIRGGARLGIYFVESGADLRAMRVVYDRAGSAFATMSADDVDWDATLEGASWFHVSGISLALGSGSAESVRRAATAARARGIPVSLDLNYRPALWTGRDPRELVRPVAALCDTIIGNPGAVKAMLGVETPATAPEPPEALRATALALRKELGCRRVALTRREVISSSEHGWSAVLYDATGDSFVESRRYQVRVVDRVGGGDSFNAGLIYGLLEGYDNQRALDFATAASALKLTIPGDFNRVTADEVHRLLEPAR